MSLGSTSRNPSSVDADRLSSTGGAQTSASVAVPLETSIRQQNRPDRVRLVPHTQGELVTPEPKAAPLP